MRWLGKPFPCSKTLCGSQADKRRPRWFSLEFETPHGVSNTTPAVIPPRCRSTGMLGFLLGQPPLIAGEGGESSSSVHLLSVSPGPGTERALSKCSPEEENWFEPTNSLLLLTVRNVF